jgi:hypothetical protein
MIYEKFSTEAPQNIGFAWRTWSLGFVNPCTTATLPTSVYYLHLCARSKYRFDVFWRLYIVECGMLFWKI